MGSVVKHAENGIVYRICAVNDERWDVLRGSSLEPVATFHDKHAAAAYAMSLARARRDWQLPHPHQQDVLRSIFNQSRIHE
jgi:hypothetical protein